MNNTKIDKKAILPSLISTLIIAVISLLPSRFFDDMAEYIPYRVILLLLLILIVWLPFFKSFHFKPTNKNKNIINISKPQKKALKSLKSGQANIVKQFILNNNKCLYLKKEEDDNDIIKLIDLDIIKRVPNSFDGHGSYLYCIDNIIFNYLKNDASLINK